MSQSGPNWIGNALQCVTVATALSVALQSSSDPLQQETALRAAESLIRSQPVDLSEVGGGKS